SQWTGARSATRPSTEPAAGARVLPANAAGSTGPAPSESVPDLQDRVAPRRRIVAGHAQEWRRIVIPRVEYVADRRGDLERIEDVLQTDVEIQQAVPLHGIP